MRFLTNEERRELLVKTAAAIKSIPTVGIKTKFNLGKRTVKSNLSYIH